MNKLHEEDEKSYGPATRKSILFMIIAPLVIIIFIFSGCTIYKNSDESASSERNEAGSSGMIMVSEENQDAIDELTLDEIEATDYALTYKTIVDGRKMTQDIFYYYEDGKQIPLINGCFGVGEDEYTGEGSNMQEVISESPWQSRKDDSITVYTYHGDNRVLDPYLVLEKENKVISYVYGSIDDEWYAYPANEYSLAEFEAMDKDYSAPDVAETESGKKSTN